MSTIECMTLVYALFDANLVNLRIHCCVVSELETGKLRCEQTLEVEGHAKKKPNLKKHAIYLLSCAWKNGTQLNHW